MKIRSITFDLNPLKPLKKENPLRRREEEKSNLFIVILWIKYIYGFRVKKTKKTKKWDFKNLILNFRIGCIGKWKANISTIWNGLNVVCNTFSTLYVHYFYLRRKDFSSLNTFHFNWIWNWTTFPFHRNRLSHSFNIGWSIDFVRFFWRLSIFRWMK